MAFLPLCVDVCTLNLTIGHREGSARVLCCWSPPLPFACLSDVLLGWAPHGDGVDKMTGGGHTPVNVNLALKHRFPRSTEAPTHQKKKKEEDDCSIKKASSRELVIYISTYRVTYMHKQHTAAQSLLFLGAFPGIAYCTDLTGGIRDAF